MTEKAPAYTGALGKISLLMQQELLRDNSIHVQLMQYQELLLRYGCLLYQVRVKYNPVIRFFCKTDHIQVLHE